MEDAEQVVRILLQHAPHSALVFSDDGFSALDIHIISYSRLYQNRQESTGGRRSSTGVLRALLDGQPSLVQPRLYGTRMRGPVELLYRCNINAFKEASGADLRRGSSCSVTSTISDWWAFKWTLVLLRASWSPNNSDDDAPFSAVHAAAQIVACPSPILVSSFVLPDFSGSVQSQEVDLLVCPVALSICCIPISSHAVIKYFPTYSSSSLKPFRSKPTTAVRSIENSIAHCTRFVDG